MNMLNLHVYDPAELKPSDWRELHRLGFSTDDVSCVIFTTKLSEDGEHWDGRWPIHPAWRCVNHGHWFVYYHS